MDSALYNRDILRLATSLAADHRLAAPDGSAEVRSPLCGSRIQADIVTDADGTLRGLALRANACALKRPRLCNKIKIERRRLDCMKLD